MRQGVIRGTGLDDHVERVEVDTVAVDGSHLGDRVEVGVHNHLRKGSEWWRCHRILGWVDTEMVEAVEGLSSYRGDECRIWVLRHRGSSHSCYRGRKSFLMRQVGHRTQSTVQTVGLSAWEADTCRKERSFDFCHPLVEKVVVGDVGSKVPAVVDVGHQDESFSRRRFGFVH